MGFFDKVESFINRVSPTWGVSRSAARSLIEIQNAATQKAVTALSGGYDAAHTNRNQVGWIGSGGSPDSDIDAGGGLPYIRARSRDASQNNGRARGILDAYANGVVGKGLRVEPAFDFEVLGISEEQAAQKKAEIKEGFRVWSKYSDASQRLDFYAQQYQAGHSISLNGESIYLPQNVKGTESPSSFRLMAIESDRLETPPELSAIDSRVHAGIKIGARFGEPVTYYFRKNHPGDDYSYTTEATGYFAVPAHDKTGRKLVFHSYKQERAGQTRGVPLLAPALQTLLDMKKYNEAEKLAALLGACIGLIIGNSDGEGINGLLSTSADGTQQVEELYPGMVAHTNGTITQVNPNRPGNNYKDFIQEQDRDVCLAASLSREFGMKDISSANFSSLKWAIVDARRVFSVIQSLLVHTFCQPSYEHWLDLEVYEGRINLPGYLENRAAWQKTNWIPDAHQWVDLKSETQATALGLEKGIITFQEVAASRTGGTAEDLIKQRGIERKLLDKEGLLPVVKPEPGEAKPVEKNQKKENENNESRS